MSNAMVAKGNAKLPRHATKGPTLHADLHTGRAGGLTGEVHVVVHVPQGISTWSIELQQLGNYFF